MKTKSEILTFEILKSAGILRALLAFQFFSFSAFAVDSGAHGMGRWEALAMLESGNSDTARGPCGELSRYQMTPWNWTAAARPGDSPANQWQALGAAMRLQGPRVAAFCKRHGRMPGDAEWYLLWHRPARVLGRASGAMSAQELDRAKRFENLCRLKS
jgi:hypothetical protein